MAQKLGRVIDIKEGNLAEVLIERGDACHNCESSQFCHALSDCSKLKTSVINRAGADVGDQVVIELRTGMIFKGAFLLYLMPVIGMLAGAVSGNDLSSRMGLDPTISSIGFAFLGFALGFLIPFLFSRSMSADKTPTPMITRIVKRRAGDLKVRKATN